MLEKLISSGGGQSLQGGTSGANTGATAANISTGAKFSVPDSGDNTFKAIGMGLLAVLAIALVSRAVK